MRAPHPAHAGDRQVVDPYTGAALAEAPGLPDPVENMVWEFPR
jgi:hypothetical protein